MTRHTPEELKSFAEKYGHLSREEFITQARKEMGYSQKTAPFDIFRNFSKYMDIAKFKKIDVTFKIKASDEKIVEFIKTHSHLQGSDYWKAARKYLGYSMNTKSNIIQMRLDSIKKKYKNTLNGTVEVKEEIKQKPGKRAYRHTKGLNEILDSSSYTFQVRIIRLMMAEKEFEAFVKKYLETKEKNKKTNNFIPSTEDLESFDKFTKGEIELKDLGQAFGITEGNVNNKYKITQRIGAIYAYLAENKRKANNGVSGTKKSNS